MRRTLCVLAILAILPTFAFGQMRQRAAGPRPPSSSMPGIDLFANASSSSVNGIVSAVSGNVISIAEGAITIDASDAKVVAPDGSVSTITSVKPGDFIAVLLKSADVAAGASLPAALVAIIKLPNPALNGPIQSIDTATQSFTVLGQTIHVTPQTRFAGGMFMQPSAGFSDLRVGEIVLVQATPSSGRLVADSVVAMSMMPLPVTHIHGKVKTIGTDSWTITDQSSRDVVVQVNNDTKILGSPVVGSNVDVLAIIDSGNRYVALTIINSDVQLPTVPPLVTYHGVVKKITPGTWTVRDNATNNDVKFLVWAGTQIDSGINVNDRVVVTARTDSFGNVVAYSIKRDL